MTTSTGRTYYASERIFLEFLDRRSTIVFNVIQELPAGKIYTQGIGEKSWVIEDWEPPRKSVPIHHYGSLYDQDDNFNAPWESSWERLNSQSREDQERFKEDEKKVPYWKQNKINRELKRARKERDKPKFSKDERVILLDDKFTGASEPEYYYLGFSNTKKQIAEIVEFLRSTGCYCCTDTPSIGEKIWWKSEEEFLCDRCYSSAFIRVAEVGKEDNENERNAAFEGLFVQGQLKAA